MNPATSQQNPGAESTERDVGLWACDQRDSRTLPPGLYHDGANLRCTESRPETRKGVLKPAWANQVAGDFVSSNGTPYGLGTFQDPNGSEWQITAAAGDVCLSRPYNARSALPLPAGVRVLSRCTFVQAFNELFCFRGRHLAPLRLTNLNLGFKDIVPHWNEFHTYDPGEEAAYGPFLAVTSLTRSGTTATVVTSAMHGYVTGADVTLRGALETEYNGRVNITVTDEFTFTYQVSGSPSTPATGTLTVSNMIQYWKANLATTDDDYDALLNPAAGESPDSAPTKWNRVYDVLPNADNALYMNGRLLVPTAYEPATVDDYAHISTGAYNKKDFIVCTSYLDPVHFDFRDEFRINQGSDDEIVDLARVPFDDAVVVWKNHSWGILNNVRLDLADVTFDLRSNIYGLSARGAWAESGRDIQFLSNRRGITSIQQSEGGKLIGSDVPLSAPIQRTIDRINWQLVSDCRMANWSNRLYLSCTLDAATPALLVFDFTAAEKFGDRTQGWTPVDTGSALDVCEWFKMQLDGQERLFFMDAEGWVNLMEESDCGDQIADADSDTGLAFEEIETRFTSRSLAGDLTKFGVTKPVDGLLWLETFNPQYTIELLFGNGLRKTTVRNAKTRSAVRYTRPYGRADWNPSNVNADHLTPYREDYRVAVATTGVTLGAGVPLLQFAETPERYHVNGRAAREFQVNLINTQGRVKLRSLALESVPGRDRRGVLA